VKGLPLRYVVDAGVGVSLVITGQFSNQAQALFAHLTTNPPAQLYVPDLFYIECTNVLWKQLRWAGYPTLQARGDLKNISALALRNVSTAELMVGAFEIAAAHNISAYDACYVALSQQVRAPLITADAKLVRTLAQTHYKVEWLGALNIPPLPDAQK